MKIAIITGHFMPEIGYQETYLARAFSKLTHEVCVFTTNKISPSKKKVINLDNYKVGILKEEKYKYKIHRLKTSFSFGSLVLCKTLKFKVLEYEPNLIIVIGVGKFFPHQVFNLKLKTPYKIATLMGNNLDYYSWNTLRSKVNSIKNILTLKIIKRWIYRRSIKYSDKIFVYTNDTERIIRSLLSKKLKKEFTKKIVNTSLGYDSNEFYFNENDFFNIRDQYKIPYNSCVIVTSTRINKEKKLETIIDCVSEIQNSGLDLYYFIIGFTDDIYEKELKNYIKTKKNNNKFICLPFLPHEKIREIFCASDFGIWLQAAISIQEAMGTGLHVILENKGSVNHLIYNGINGWLFDKGHFKQILINGIEETYSISLKLRIKKRIGTQKFNSKKFSYEKITKAILKELEK